MLTWLIVLAAGVGLLLVSTNSLVSASKLLAVKWRVSPLIVGSLVIALITSLPELTVSLVAVLRHDTRLALGNIIGSNIINILLVFPVGILVGKLRVGTTKTQRSSWFLLAVTILFAVLTQTTLSPFLIGTVLLILAVLYILAEYIWAANGRKEEDAKVIKHYQSMHPKWSITNLFFPAAGIVIGGLLVVVSIENIAYITGLSTGFLGLTLAALATSLPELLTSVFSQEQHLAKETLGDIIGSNFYNLLLIGGLVFLLSRPSSPTTVESLWLVSTTGLFVIIVHVFRGRVIPKLIGLALPLICLLYLLSIYATT